MPREPRAYLHDMREAAGLIAEFTDGLDLGPVNETRRRNTCPG